MASKTPKDRKEIRLGAIAGVFCFPSMSSRRSSAYAVTAGYSAPSPGEMASRRLSQQRADSPGHAGVMGTNPMGAPQLWRVHDPDDLHEACGDPRDGSERRHAHAAFISHSCYHRHRRVEPDSDMQRARRSGFTCFIATGSAA